MSLTLIAEARPTARKSHGCNACLGRIQPGEQYDRQRVADSGDAWTWKAHRLCSAIVDHLWAEDCYFSDESPGPDEVHEVLRDLLGGLLGAPA